MMTKTLLRLTFIGLLTASAANAEFAMPENSELKEVIQNPAKIESLIASANEEQCALLIIQVISLMQAEGSKAAAIQNTVAVMFQKTAEIHGAEFGSTVVALVRKKVNPRLLPDYSLGQPSSTPASVSKIYKTMTLRRIGIVILFLLVVYPMWITGGTQVAWQLPLPVLAALLLGVTVATSHQTLRRDPILPIGMFFLLLLLVQWGNSNRSFIFDPVLQAWIVGPPPLPFLPSSVSRPDAAEMLRWFFPVWTIALASRHLVAAEDHRPLRNAILTAAIVLAAGSIIQFSIAVHWHFGKIPSNSYFISSFGYANQAGSFFVLCFCITMGTMLSAMLHHRRASTKTGALLGCLLTLGGVLISLSRSAAMMAVIIIFCSVIYAIRYRHRESSLATQFNRIAAIVAIAISTFLIIYPIVGDPIMDELSKRQPQTADLSLPANWTYSAIDNIRPLYRKIAVNVLRDNFCFGAGGWAVRHLGFLYVPASRQHLLQTEGAANTHNDTLQFLSEFGVIGVALLWVGIGIMAAPLVRYRQRIWESPKLVFSLLGLLAICVQSFIDIPFRSPAILFLWTLCLGMTASRLENRHKRDTRWRL